jgi:hypothetical protein
MRMDLGHARGCHGLTREESATAGLWLMLFTTLTLPDKDMVSCLYPAMEASES